MTRLFLPVFLFFSFTGKISAQSVIYLNTDDTIHYCTDSYDSFLGNAIKKNAFKDGNYIFYSDSSSKNIFFKGNINKGLTNGWYYRNQENNGVAVPFLKMSNGIPDSVCRFDRYYCNFNSGKLQELTVVDWSNGGDEKNDSISIYFKSGKIDSLHFCVANPNSKLSSIFQKEFYNDTSKLEPLGKNAFDMRDEDPHDTSIIIRANVYNSFKNANEKNLGDDFEILNVQHCDHKPINMDSLDSDPSLVKVNYRIWNSVMMVYWRTIHFDNTNDELTLYYDSSRHLREMHVSSIVTIGVDVGHDKTYGIETLMNFNSRGNLQHVSCPTGVVEEETANADGTLGEIQVVQTITDIQLYPDGRLRFRE